MTARAVVRVVVWATATTWACWIIREAVREWNDYRVDHPDRVEWTVTPAAASELTAIATGQPSPFDTSGDAA